MDILKLKKALQLVKIVNPFSVLRIGIKNRYNPVKINYNGKKISSPDSSILLSGIHEIFINEIYQFDNHNKIPCIIDCGANIGLSVIYFKKNNPDAQIYAFEADPKIFDYLNENLNSYFGKHDINLIKKAVWNKNGTISFRPEGSASGRIEDVSKDHTINIPCIRLKDFLDQFESIDLLKMDIEGAEFEVLMDCKESMKKCKYIFVEFHSFVNKENRFAEILLMMASLGFKYYFKEASNNPHPFKSIKVIDGMDFQINGFFINEQI
jgi:FkbM family methyltransferase